MTIYLPLEASLPFPQSPSFLSAVSNPTAHLAKVVAAVLKARRIAVVCGAGISVQAGIPDFRSPDGLFQTLKRDNPREALTSGKDLFDASVFNSENTTALFCQMIARLSELSLAAKPTAFHTLLRALDDRGNLLRVYTQNIDALELKAGLSFGLPAHDERRSRTKTQSVKGKSKEDAFADVEVDITNVTEAGPSQLPSVSPTVPRCIPLHGTLQTMHCQTCTHTFPLTEHVASLALGVPPDCPECTSLEATRHLIGKRLRGVGKLRPSVVLYNEAHRDGEGVGEVARKDLIGTSKGKNRQGADLLFVVGTSLRVPGTKRIVREFSKAVRSRGNSSSLSSKHPTPSPSPRRSPSCDDEIPIKTIYLNFDFPLPTRDWDGVFDVWIQGDAQEFAAMLGAEIEKEETAKRAALDKRRHKDEEEGKEHARPLTGDARFSTQSITKDQKRKTAEATLVEHPVMKKRKVTLIVRPPTSPKEHVTSTPPRKSLPLISHPAKATTRGPHHIPVRHTHPRLVPEVVIEMPPQSNYKDRTHALTPPRLRQDHRLLTPSPMRRVAAHVSGPPRCRGKLLTPSTPTKKPRKRAQPSPSTPTRARPSKYLVTPPVTPVASGLGMDDRADSLKSDESLARTLQYGLRSSRQCIKLS